MRLQTHDSARLFLAHAEPWLLRSEAEHSLVLSIAGRLADAPAAPPAFFATLHQTSSTSRFGAEVVGVVVRTPPYKLLLSRMPLDAISLVADAAERFESIPAVLGPIDVAQAFGTEWARRRPVTPRLGTRQRIFRLTALVPPDRPARGSARRAEAGDLGRVADWIDAFHEEVGLGTEDGRAWAERHVLGGDVLLWEDGQPVAMAAAMARSPTGTRIGGVWTPPVLRGRGYATSVVAELTRRQLDEGRRFCSLYTDLANPTSNAIYQRLGYVSVADVVDVEFDGGSPTGK